MSSAEAYKTTVAQSIRRQRLALNISQAALADGVGVSKSSISRWELGEGVLNAHAHDRIKRFFKGKWAEQQSRASEGGAL